MGVQIQSCCHLPSNRITWGVGVEIYSLGVERDGADSIIYVSVVKEEHITVLRKVNMRIHINMYLSLTSPGDVQVSPLTSPSIVPVHILTPKAQETVHAHIQASLTFLYRRNKHYSLLQYPSSCLSVVTHHLKLSVGRHCRCLKFTTASPAAV